MNRPLRYSSLLILPLISLLGGCLSDLSGPRPTSGIELRGVQFTDALRATVEEQPADPKTRKPAAMRAARNETVFFATQITPVPPGAGKNGPILRLSPLRRVGGNPDAAGQDVISVEAYSAWQVLPMPINTNHAGFVRHTGLPVSTHQLPRALLPLSIKKGELALAQLRDPADATNPQSKAAGKSAQVWIDVAVPTLAQPGEYQATLECIEDGRTVATLPLSLTVYDFVLPDERHLQMVSQLKWDDLERLWGVAVTPEYLSRTDAKHAQAIKVLDQLVTLAQQHRVVLTVPQLAPVVKWTFNRNPQCNWEDYDGVVSPWLSGSAFADKVPLGYWPMPKTRQHDSLSPTAQQAYWQAVASHFDQVEGGWLARSAAEIDNPNPRRQRVRPDQALALSEEAANTLAANGHLRVSLPLEEHLVRVLQQNMPNLIDKADLERVMAVAPALVTTGVGAAPVKVGRRWLRTDVEGIIPYVGAGADERETRLWAWLAYLRDAELIQWPCPLPSRSDPKTPADPDELVWFYPGSWFGIDQPLPSVQLKWMRRAQQDYEYLALARTRGQPIQTRVMARLLTKPVEIDARQPHDPAYALVCGTSDPQVWSEALDLLARIILLRPPGQNVDTQEEARLGAALLNWITPQERPMLLGRSTGWTWALNKQGQLDTTMLEMHLGIDIYNAADTRPARNKLQWTGVPQGWQISPNPVLIPELLMYHVTPVSIDARVRLDRVIEATRQPLDITFINGDDKREMLLRLVAPVARSDQRQGIAPALDGSLEDWTPEDCIHNGKLVRMLSRPMIQRQELQFSPVNSQLYSTWTAKDFYLAFRLEGVEPPGSAVYSATVGDYQFRRAWGQDLAEVLMQPIYEDGASGPVVRAICRPGGQVEVRRQLTNKGIANPLAPVAGVDVRYVTTVREQVTKDPAGKESKDNIWRGEVAFPWVLLQDPNDNNPAHQMPALVRLNFVQHRNAVGESASWAGPIDFGGDDAFTGILHLRAFRPAAPLEVPRIGVRE